jgi:hypothetical protein
VKAHADIAINGADKHATLRVKGESTLVISRLDLTTGKEHIVLNVPQGHIIVTKNDFTAPGSLTVTSSSSRIDVKGMGFAPGGER